jgi:hypothetical protein
LRQAATLLGIDPVSDERTNDGDHSTRLREWAWSGTRHLTRAILAVADNSTVEAGDWPPTARQSLTHCLHRLGYQSTTQ